MNEEKVYAESLSPESVSPHSGREALCFGSGNSSMSEVRESCIQSSKKTVV